MTHEFCKQVLLKIMDIDSSTKAKSQFLNLFHKLCSYVTLHVFNDYLHDPIWGTGELILKRKRKKRITTNRRFKQNNEWKKGVIKWGNNDKNCVVHVGVSKSIKGDLRTICRFSYMKVYKLITLGTKFKTPISLGRKITMFSKFITNYIEQGWWHSSLTLKCMHLLLKEVNKRGRHAYNLHGWTCLPSGIVMEIHCHITGIFEAAVRLRLPV